MTTTMLNLTQTLDTRHVRQHGGQLVEVTAGTLEQEGRSAVPDDKAEPPVHRRVARMPQQARPAKSTSMDNDTTQQAALSPKELLTLLEANIARWKERSDAHTTIANDHKEAEAKVISDYNNRYPKDPPSIFASIALARTVYHAWCARSHNGKAREYQDKIKMAESSASLIRQSLVRKSRRDDDSIGRRSKNKRVDNTPPGQTHVFATGSNWTVSRYGPYTPRLNSPSDIQASIEAGPMRDIEALRADQREIADDFKSAILRILAEKHPDVLAKALAEVLADQSYNLDPRTFGTILEVTLSALQKHQETPEQKQPIENNDSERESPQKKE